MKSIIVSVVSAFAATVTVLADEPPALRQTAADLRWRLPRYATRDGDILTVDVPEDAAREGCRVWAEVDLSAFDGLPIEATIEAEGWNIGTPRAAWNGLKFQFEYKDADTGEMRYPNTASRRGDFPRQTLQVRDSLCGRRISPARLFLGLQDTSGKVVFDLSTLSIRAGHLYWPVTNQTHRCEYSAPVGMFTNANGSQIANDTNDNGGAPGGRALPAGADRQAAPLRGVMSPSRDMTEDDFRTLADWGATLLRYQMVRRGLKQTEELDLASFGTWLETKLAHCETVVLPMARKYGIKVVLDLHFAPGGREKGAETHMFHDAECAARFIQTWREIATRFRGNADVIYGYDLVNEPMQKREALPECDWWSLQRRAAEAIREIDTETPIIVESNLLDHPESYGMMSPLTLTNVIYEVHVYNPTEFTHQGVGGPREAKSYPDSRRGWDQKFLRRVVGPVRAFEQRHGAKIYVGEFSAIAWADGADEYLSDLIGIFNEYGWDWTYHAFREWNGWSVEHEGPDAQHMVPAADTPRKRALLDGIRGADTP